MKIIVSGGYRVGGTWCYNILKDLMGVPGGFATEGDIQQQLEKPGDNVIKIHLWRPIMLPESEPVKIVCPMREYIGQAASLLMMHRTPVDAARQLVLAHEYQDWLAQHRHWFAEVAFIRYYEIETYPKAAALDLAQVTGLGFSEEAIVKLVSKWDRAAVAKQCKTMEGEFDEGSLFRRNHITYSNCQDIPDGFWDILENIQARG